MARKGITFDQVANEAAAITARGVEPTMHEIRKGLGGTGSYSTISNHLSKWKVKQAEVIEVQSVPEAVQNKSMEIAKTVWALALKEATAEIAAIRQKAKDETDELKIELNEAVIEIKRLEEIGDKLADQVTALENKAREAEIEKVKAESERDTAKQSFTSLVEELKLHAEQPQDGKMMVRRKSKRASSANAQS